MIDARKANSVGRACSLESDDDGLELVPNRLGKLLEAGIVDCHHRRHVIDRGNLDLSVSRLLHHDVARKHRADLILGLQCVISERRVARAEDLVVAEIDTELLVQRLLDVDLGDDGEALPLQRLGRVVLTLDRTPVRTKQERIRSFCARA